MKFLVACHTDNIGPGSTYVVIAGKKYDGMQFIPHAIENGATTIVIGANAIIPDGIEKLCTQKNIHIKRVENTRRALAQLSAVAYDYPAKKLKLVGVTGTDGKTTSTYLLFNMLKMAGKKVALFSGVEQIIEEEIVEATLTTPQPDYLHYFFNRCVQQGIEYVVIELSAQATTYHRLDGLLFDGLIFTNLSQEHGEEYQSIEEYFAAKCAILAQKKKNAPLIVHDSPWAKRIKKIFQPVFIAGQKADLDYQAVSLQETFGNQLMEINFDAQWYPVETSLVGSYNVSNIIGATALAHQLGITREHILMGIKNCSGVAGRFERYRLKNGTWAVVDYAHTPQAFGCILPTLKKHARQLIVVFGAAGGKDIGKRSLMGQLAAQFADEVILTNDNPRNEDPLKIMDAVASLLNKYEQLKIHREPDRAKAIQLAYQLSQSGDIIAILGKGHETMQTIGTQRFHHNDAEIVKSLN